MGISNAPVQLALRESGTLGTISPSRRAQLTYSESVNVRHAKAWSHDVRSCLIVAKGRFLKRAAEFGRLQVTARLLLPGR